MTGEGPAGAPDDSRGGRGVYAALGLATFATLMLEIGLTRLFSVILYYHFAYVVLSVAMFGLTTGAIVVYALARHRTSAQLAKAVLPWGLGLGPLIALSAALLLAWPQVTDVPMMSPGGTCALFLLSAAPFLCSGVLVTYLLVHTRRPIGGLYAADLGGAALGCLAVIGLFPLLGGPRLLFFIAWVAGVAAVLFVRSLPGRPWLRSSVALCGLLALGWIVPNPLQEMRVVWEKRVQPGQRPAYEAWNESSYIQVIDMPPGPVGGWGLSPRTPPELLGPHRQKAVLIDAAALTRLIQFDGNLASVRSLQWDITALPHHMRPSASTAVIGVGGGMDVLTALTFHQPSVVALEYNGNILDLVRNRYADFGGHLAERPGVRFVHDEARSWLTRTDQRFDIIQASLIDTWAATNAGAFVLAENSLYSVDAWQIFLARLRPGGVLNMTRFHREGDHGETARLFSLAIESLRVYGAPDPGRNVLLAAKLPEGASAPVGMAGILISPTPFSDADIAHFHEICTQFGWKLLYAPDATDDPVFAGLAAGGESYRRTVAEHPLDISAPTDDRPFFFQLLRWTRPPTHFDLDLGDVTSVNMWAAVILASLLGGTVLLTLLCVVLPLRLLIPAEERRHPRLRGLALYFGAIGAAFMLIEVALMQRLNLFLGHPVYGLAVVLFSLLLFGGLGSLLSDRLGRRSPRATWRMLGGALLAAVLVIGEATPWVTRALVAEPTAVRVLVSVAILAPLGVLMGMPFPWGMRAARAVGVRATAWLWGINGATSVTAGVLGMVLSLGLGIRAAFLVGWACYVVAVVTLARTWAAVEE